MQVQNEINLKKNFEIKIEKKYFPSHHNLTDILKELKIKIY
jgi:alpha-glucuronidase